LISHLDRLRIVCLGCSRIVRLHLYVIDLPLTWDVEWNWNMWIILADSWLSCMMHVRILCLSLFLEYFFIFLVELWPSSRAFLLRHFFLLLLAEFKCLLNDIFKLLKDLFLTLEHASGNLFEIYFVHHFPWKGFVIQPWWENESCYLASLTLLHFAT
jgi:hypothetical protein